MGKIGKRVSALALAFVFACGSDPTPEPNGEACEVDKDCESEYCATILGDTYELPDGLCTVECNGQTNEGCDPDMELCLTHIASGDTACFQRCIGYTDCREGWECYNVGFFFPDFVCLPEVTQ